MQSTKFRSQWTGEKERREMKVEASKEAVISASRESLRFAFSGPAAFTGPAVFSGPATFASWLRMTFACN